MFRILLLAAVLLPLHGIAQNSVYRTVDEHGNVVFTDTPPANGASSEPVDVRRTNITAPPENIYQPAKTAEEPTSDTTTPTKVTITQPANETTIALGPGNFQVVASVTPALKESEKLQLYVDAAPHAGPQTATTWALTNISRGPHDLTVQVVDGEGATVATSDAVRVYVLRPALGTTRSATPGAPEPDADGNWGRPDENGQWNGRPRFR